MDSKKIAAFAVHCSVNHPVNCIPEEGFVEFEVRRLKEAYYNIFGSEISNHSIVMIVTRGTTREVENMPGRYYHVMGRAELPAWVSELLTLLSIDVVPTDINGHNNVPSWCM